jgi:hypothetical protein
MAIFSRIKNFVSGETILAADTNAEFNNILNNMKAESIYSASTNAGVPDVTQMRTTSNPGTVGAESIPTDLREEVRQLKYMVGQIIGGAQWYTAPTFNINGTSQIQTANIADSAVTTVKIADSNITLAKMADNSVGTAELVDDSVTNAKMANNSVNTAELASSAVTSDKLATNSVSTSAIIDQAVTGVKIADSAVTLNKRAGFLGGTTAAITASFANATSQAVASGSFSASGSTTVTVPFLYMLHPSSNNSPSYFVCADDYAVIITIGSTSWRFNASANVKTSAFSFTTSELLNNAPSYTVTIQQSANVSMQVTNMALSRVCLA